MSDYDAEETVDRLIKKQKSNTGIIAKTAKDIVPAFVIFLNGLGTAGEAVAWPRRGPPRVDTKDGTVLDAPLVEVEEEAGGTSVWASLEG